MNCKLSRYSKLSLYFAIFIIVLELISFIFIKNESLGKYISLFASLILSLLVVLVSFCSFLNTDKKFNYVKMIFLLTFICFTLRFFGELTWVIYELGLNVEVPSPSLADLFWQTSYLFIIVAISTKINNMFFDKKNLIISLTLIFCTLISFIYVYFNVIPHLSGLKELELLGFLVNFLYVIFDIFVVGLLILILYPALTDYNPMMRTYIFIILGFISFCIYDIWFAQQVVIDNYSTGNFIDIFYDLGYFLVFYGILIKKQVIKSYKGGKVK